MTLWSSQLNKLKSTRENTTDVTRRLSANMAGTNKVFHRINY